MALSQHASVTLPQDLQVGATTPWVWPHLVLGAVQLFPAQQMILMPPHAAQLPAVQMPTMGLPSTTDALHAQVPQIAGF